MSSPQVPTEPDCSVRTCWHLVLHQAVVVGNADDQKAKAHQTVRANGRIVDSEDLLGNQAVVAGSVVVRGDDRHGWGWLHWGNDEHGTEMWKCAIAVRSGAVKTVLRVGKGLDLPKSWFLGTCGQVKLNCRQH